MLDILRSAFRPEFLNRIDDIVVFERIKPEAMRAIVDVQLTRVIHILADTKDITLTISDDVRTMLARDGYDPAFGARPLKRLIQKRILDPLALEIIDGRIRDGQAVSVALHDGKVVFAT